MTDFIIFIPSIVFFLLACLFFHLLFLQPIQTTIRVVCFLSFHRSDVQSKVWSFSSGVEDLLFHTITEGKEQVPFSYFISVSVHPQVSLQGFSTVYLSVLSSFFVPLVLKALKKTGLHPSDPRLKHCMDKFRQASRESVGEVVMDRELFRRYSGGGDGLTLFVQQAQQQAGDLIC